MSLSGVEPQILERLGARLPVGVPALAKASLDDQAAGMLRAPAVFVIPAGASVIESRPDARAARLAQRWLCLVAVRNLAEMTSGAPARTDAWTLADAVIAALMGWQPDGTSAPLALVEVADLGYLAGYQTVPLVFSTEIICRADPAS